MYIAESQNLSTDQKEALLRLWNNEYPANLGYNSPEDFDAYLEQLTEQLHYLLFNADQAILGWAFTFIRSNERWFAIILDTSIHNQGYGTMLLEHLKTGEHLLNGWVVDHNNDVKRNGTAYASPLNFYLKNMFTMCPDVRLATEKLSAVKIMWKKD
jgi:hypothetical protein